MGLSVVTHLSAVAADLVDNQVGFVTRGVVDCGAHFAPSCSECLTASSLIRTTCAGQCASLGGVCTPILEYAVRSLDEPRTRFDDLADSLLFFPAWEPSAALATQLGLRSLTPAGGGDDTSSGPAPFYTLHEARGDSIWRPVRPAPGVGCPRARAHLLSLIWMSTRIS